MKYKIKHIVQTVEGKVLYLYGYDKTGKIAFSVEGDDEIKYVLIETSGSLFVKIGSHKIMSVYLSKFNKESNDSNIEFLE